MMARKWNERDHPRHDDGRFRDRVGSSGWAGRISSAIGRLRGERDSDGLGGHGPEAQRWGDDVREAIRDAGFDPDEFEIDLNEHGEYSDDPDAYADTLIEGRMRPEADLSDGDGPKAAPAMRDLDDVLGADPTKMDRAELVDYIADVERWRSTPRGWRLDQLQGLRQKLETAQARLDRLSN